MMIRAAATLGRKAAVRAIACCRHDHNSEIMSAAAGLVSSSFSSTTDNNNGDRPTAPSPSRGNDPKDLLPGPWAKTYQATTAEEQRQAYSEWSATYDQDSTQTFGYEAPQVAALTLCRHLKTMRSNDPWQIVDVGAGTGLVGSYIAQELGLDDCVLTAVDYSEKMLDGARTKRVYRDFYCVDLLDRVALERQSLHVPRFDAAVSVGTFTPHHCGIDALDAVVHMIKPGGLLTLSLRDDFVNDHANGFGHKLQALTYFGPLELLEVTESALYTKHVSQDITFRCWTYRIGLEPPMP